VAVAAEEVALVETTSQSEVSPPRSRRTADDKTKDGGGCTSIMDTKTGTPTCWVNNGGWTQCTGLDSAKCSTVCDNAAMLASQCAGKKDVTKDDGKGTKKGANDDGKKDDGKTTATGTSSFEHTWTGQAMKTRTYSMVKPSSGNPGGMVVVLQPGGGGCGTLSSLAQSKSLLVVCPFSLGASWKAQHPGDSEDVDFIAQLITSLTASQSVPVGKVIITGFSFGGSMAFRVLCERSDVVGGIVPMGQSFLEPAGGHVPKGSESTNMTTTEQALQLMNAARKGANKCDPKFKRPHFALVGTVDNYYGETGGTYKGKRLWEFFSTNVQGCTGQISSSSAAESQAITGKTGSTCYHYSSCPSLSSASMNKYCTVDGFGHDTTGWEVLVANAFVAVFGASSVRASGSSTSSALLSTTSALHSSLLFALITLVAL